MARQQLPPQIKKKTVRDRKTANLLSGMKSRLTPASTRIPVSANKYVDATQPSAWRAMRSPSYRTASPAAHS